MSKKVIGIDLGTGNSAIATIENGSPVIIVNAEGNRTTPSIVGLKNNERKVGESAKRQRVVSPKETVSLVKRFMGVDYNQCEDIIKHVSYDVRNVNGKPRIEIEGRQYSPEEISSMILSKLKSSAEDYCGEEVTDAVITCPAWFDNNAREATKLAGEMAGLKVHRIINEPTAAILASDIDTSVQNKIVLVADIGAGTTDFSVCELSEGMVEVLSSKGDVFLGGSDFDNTIASWIVEQLKEMNGVDVSNDAQAMQRILEAAETAKIDLTTSTSTEISLPYITIKDNNPVHLSLTLTRAQMERMTSHLVEKILNCAKNAVSTAKINYQDLACILMVGGQSRSLAIREALQNEFNVELNLSINPDEAVALGAAVQANIIVGGNQKNDILLVDVTPITMGIETVGGVFTPLIEANTTIPCQKTNIFTTASDNQPSVDIKVLQGERPMAKDNKVIGLFRLDDIKPAPRGVPQIEVVFDIDANGILKVSAKDLATQKTQSITIESKGSLTQEEIERIKAEAKEHAESDKKEREIADKLNEFDTFIFMTEKVMNENSDKINEDDKNEITLKLSQMKELLKNKNMDELSSLQTEIQSKMANIINNINETATPTEETENVTDAEYSEA